MRPAIVTASASGASSMLVVDYVVPVFAIGIGCVVSNGASLTYKVQHSFDDPNLGANNMTWFDHAFITGQTGNKDGNYAFPIRATRLNVTAFSSGTVTMTILQGGMTS